MSSKLSFFFILTFLIPSCIISNPTLDQIKTKIKEDFPKTEFRNIKKNNSEELIALIEQNNQTIILDRFLLSTLYTILLNKDKDKKKKALVRFFGENRSISPEEKDFWEKRDLITSQSLSKILNKTIPSHVTPRIALISSGGGFRAMISFAGFLNKLNEQGLLDASHLIGGVSGSTWLIYPWMASKKPFSEFYPSFVERVLKGILYTKPENQLTNITTFTSTLIECFLRRLAFKEIPTSIDLYGLILGLHLFDETTKKRYTSTTLSSIKPFVATGSVPLPITTAIVQHNGRPSDEVEFNPFEVINYGLQAGCPSFGFGRSFYNGTSTSKHPAQTLGFLMGVCGSAFSQKVKNYIPTIKTFCNNNIFINSILDIIEKTPVTESRLFPDYIKNYTRGMNVSPDKHTLFHAYIDAGLNYDAPMLPTLNPERNIDIIVLVESGSNVNWSGSLKIFQDIAHKNNYPFPKIDLERAKSQPFSIFTDGPESNAPIIIYVPLIKNPQYSESFDPWELIYPYQSNFLNMMNFFYSREEYNLLAGLFEQAATELYPQFIACIQETIEKKEKNIRPQNNQPSTT